jgi:hypothetical protein
MCTAISGVFPRSRVKVLIGAKLAGQIFEFLGEERGAQLHSDVGLTLCLLLMTPITAVFIFSSDWQGGCFPHIKDKCVRHEH